MKKILVLGTGKPQGDLMRACKERGMEVFACSYKSGYPSEKDADHFELINITDAESVKEYAKRIGADYVYSAGSDVAMPTALSVSEELGLVHFCPSEAALICNHKPSLRDALGNGFPGNIRHIKVTSPELPHGVSFPLMMKPSDAQGQRGVVRVDSYEEYKNNFERSISFSREGALILEEFVEGCEISVNTFSANGELVFFLPSERVTWEDLPGGIIHRHVLPLDISDELREKIRDLVVRTLQKLKIGSGPAYFQIMIDRSNEPKLIEVTPRLDGCHMWRLIKYSTGVDLMSMTLDALEGVYPASPVEFSVKPYETEFLCLKPGSVFGKSMFDVSPCEYLEWYYNDGETVKEMNGYMEKCGYAIRPLG